MADTLELLESLEKTRREDEAEKAQATRKRPPAAEERHKKGQQRMRRTELEGLKLSSVVEKPKEETDPTQIKGIVLPGQAIPKKRK